MQHWFRTRFVACLVMLLCFAAVSVGQATPPAEQQEYNAAVAAERGPAQLVALERFLAAHPQSRLKLDALELLVWNARTSASLADLEYWTGQLIALSADNPLASAVIIGDSLNISAEDRVTRAKRVLPAMDAFDRPEGLSHDEFAEMKNFVMATLNGVIGYSYFEQKDFVNARPYLRKAVEITPRNAQYTYTLALSDLQGVNPDQAEGYKMLARSVNLTKGTAAGDKLAAFARQNFQQAGGTSANWDKYLAATVMPPAPPVEAPEAVASVATSSPATTTAANASTTATAARTTATNSARPSPSAVAPNSSGRVSLPSSSISTPNAAAMGTMTTTASVPPAAAPSVNRAPAVMANNGTSTLVAGPAPPAPVPAAAAAPSPPSPPVTPDVERPLRVFPVRPPRHIAPGSPVSVGLLIQASLADRLNRRPVVFTLSDLVRHLREKDEAFIMSFSRGVVFQEDLTSNSKSLESAMDSIDPTPGSAIYDAVTFAAGHLNRVARNPNRVLLVVAAEGDRDSTVSPLELSSEINLSGVTIYCIGVGVMTPADQDRLEALASSTGGQAIFIPDLSHFRDATRTVAQGLGLSLPN